MVKAVIFDVDGTLGETIPLCVAAFQDCAEEATGRRPTAEEVQTHFGVSDRGVLAALLGMQPDDPALPVGRLAHFYENRHADMAPEPYPGIPEMLGRLRAAGIRLALVTGKEAYTAEPTLRRFGLDGMFEWKGLGEPTRNCKCERLQELLALWGLSPDEAIYVGDAPSDIEHSRRAGIRVINAAWASTAKAEEAACVALCPDYRLERVEELEPLLTKLIA